MPDKVSSPGSFTPLVALSFGVEGGDAVPVSPTNPIPIAGKQETLALVADTVVAAPQSAYGGDYILVVTGKFNGASFQLQYLGPDQATYMDAGAALTAPGNAFLKIASNATVRARITGGTPAGINASLGKVPS